MYEMMNMINATEVLISPIRPALKMKQVKYGSTIALYMAAIVIVRCHQWTNQESCSNDSLQKILTGLINQKELRAYVSHITCLLVTARILYIKAMFKIHLRVHSVTYLRCFFANLHSTSV